MKDIEKWIIQTYNEVDDLLTWKLNWYHSYELWKELKYRGLYWITSLYVKQDEEWIYCITSSSNWLVRVKTKDELRNKVKLIMKENYFKDKVNNIDVVWNDIIDFDDSEVSLWFDDLDLQIKELENKKKEREQELEERGKFFNKSIFSLWDVLISPSKANYLTRDSLSIQIQKEYKFNKSYNDKFVDENDSNDWVRAFDDFFQNVTEKNFWIKENSLYTFELNDRNKEVIVSFKKPFYLKEQVNGKLIYKKVKSIVLKVDENIWELGILNNYDDTWLICTIVYISKKIIFD